MEKYTGKSLEEILETVAMKKGVTKDELYYYVLDEKQGFFGLGTQVTAEVFCLEDVKDFIQSYLMRFFKNLDQIVEINIEQSADNFKVMLNAENNAIIIGKNGQTLQAINTVVRGAANSFFKRRFRIMVDINNYKGDRYDRLKTMAYRIAKTVQTTKIDALLDPMPNDERRIIHQYLNEMNNIRTESEGEGKERRLRIIYDETTE